VSVLALSDGGWLATAALAVAITCGIGIIALLAAAFGEAVLLHARVMFPRLFRRYCLWCRTGLQAACSCGKDCGRPWCYGRFLTPEDVAVLRGERGWLP
jgi:hypothetical protein